MKNYTMNHYRFLLELRGITDLKSHNWTLAQAIRNTGGDPTVEERLQVSIWIEENYLKRINELEIKLLATKTALQILDHQDKFKKYHK